MTASNILNAQKRGLKLQTKAIDSVLLPNRTLRQHSASKLAKLKRSIERFGQFPILIDTAGNVVDGLLTLQAVRELGLETVQVLCASGYTSSELKALRIALNKHAENGKWDEDLLREELSQLLDLEFEVDELGFEVAEVDNLFKIVDDDEAEEESLLPISQSFVQIGDVFQFSSGHRLMCGSALQSEDIGVLMEGEKADVVVTDPPFNVPVTGHVTGLGKIKHREFVMASGELSDSEFEVFLFDFLIATKSACREGSLIYAAMDWRGIRLLLNAGEKAELELINICVWAKTNAGMGSFYRSQHELFAVFRKPGAAHRNNVELGKHGRYRTNVWNYEGANSFSSTRETDLSMHPTVKPTPLIEDIIKDCTKRRDIVLDPFGGSGTTLMAAQKAGRIAYLMELDAGYVETILNRYSLKYDEKIIHVGTGLTFSQLKEQRSNLEALPQEKKAKVRQRTRVTSLKGDQS